MPFVRSCLVSAVFAFAHADVATAAPLQAPEVVRGLCEKDGCAEFAILEREEVGKGQDGTLYRTKVQTFHVSHAGRTAGSVENGFVYCSRVRPAVMSAVPGRPVSVFYITPYEDKPDWALRPTANFYTLYFAICDGPDAGRRAATDRAGVARSLGYPTSLSEPRTTALSRPEDMLARTNR